MPTYEYECLACKNRFEKFQKFSDAPVSECPECGGQVRRVIFPAGVVFKGSGWYITDSRPSSSGEGASSGPSKTEKSETKTETKAESKSETSSSSKSDSGSSGAKSESATAGSSSKA